MAKLETRRSLRKGTPGKEGPTWPNVRLHTIDALIVEDEIYFAINLEADMHALGFDICDLAANGQQASRLAMSNQPDVVLMDTNFERGREGIEVARWLR